MKNILKIVFLAVFSASLIYLLSQKNLIDFSLIKYALTDHLWLIAAVGLLQIFNYIAMTLRYKSILKILQLDKKTKNVFAASFVSSGIGQWLPGSLAFIEVIRIGLMRKNVRSDESNSLDTSHLAIASLLDRLIGLFVGLFIGSLVTLYFIITLDTQNSTNYFILLLTLAFNSLLCVIILMLPIIAGSKLMQHFLAKGEKMCLKYASHSTLHKFFSYIFHKINELIKLFASHGKNYKLFFLPMFLSVCSISGFAISLQLACIALGASLPFCAVLAVISILSIITALPISVGGIGAPQLITAVLFGSFGVNSVMATSAQLLQTGITLITISLCAIYYFPRMIKEIIKPRIA